MAFWATCKIAQPIQPIWQHILALSWSALKKPPWEFNFFHIFGITSSSRHEKCCQILRTLFWVFQYSRNSQCFGYIATFLLISLLKTPQFNFNAWNSTIKILPFSQESLVEAEANSLFDLMASFDDGAAYQGLLGLIHHLRAADIGPIFL